MKRTLVKVVAAHEASGVPNWPCIDHDYNKELSKIMDVVRGNNPDIDFDVVTSCSLPEVEKTYAEDQKKYDGVLLLTMACWKGFTDFYASRSETGIPAIIADVPYCGSGEVLSHSNNSRNMNWKAPILSTCNYAEIADAVRLFDVINKMKQTKILVVSNFDQKKDQDYFTNDWGCVFVNKTSTELLKFFNEVSEEEASEIVEKWKNEALEVVEPTEKDLMESAKLHIAIREMMKEFDCDAVTLDCLGLSYSGEYGDKHMYPCLSHYEMLNKGTVAVCEADLSATVTSLVVRYLTDKPGFVSDPVIDTSSDQIIYAHCVACPKVYGYKDNRVCSFAIRSHAEDKKGAAVQVYFPVNEKVTTTMIYSKESKKNSVIHSALAVGNVGYQEACRSKLSATTNAEAILNNWSGGWHRVTVYGDYRKQLMRLFKMKGLQCTQEDKE